MELLTALLALCEGNPPATGGFPSQRTSDMGFEFFLFWCNPKQAIEQTVELPEIWDGITLIVMSLKWS